MLPQILEKSRKAWWRDTYAGIVHRHSQGEIVCDDALRFLGSLKPECANLVFLDPPFNLGKQYGKRRGKDDRVDESRYQKYMVEVLWRCEEILKPGGALYLYHIPKWAVRLGAELDKELDFRHWIAISMKNGFVRGKHLHPAHYALLYFTRGEPADFERPKIKVPTCRHCKREVKDYGGYKKYIENGINLSDLWEDVSPVRHSRLKHRQGNELPMKVLDRVMAISGVKGGLMVDPFAGTGTSLVAARSAGMKFVACDREEMLLGTMADRLRE